MARSKIYRYGFAVAALLTIAGALGYLLGTERSLNTEQARELIGLKNTGIGYLEAGEYEASDRVFTEIIERLADDRLAKRNLVISRVLALKDNTLADAQTGAAAAHDALARLLELDPESVATYLLSARLSQVEGNAIEAFGELTRAAGITPQDAGLWYELHTVGRDVDALRGKALEALDRAIELSPHNLAVLSDWLVVKAASKDLAIVTKLERARTILEPFSESIRLHTGADLSVLLQEAIDATTTNDWPVVNARVRMITNILRPEVAVRLDRKRLIRHELEYVLFDYESPRVNNVQTVPTAPKPIPVKLVEPSAGDQLPAIAGVRDAKLIDFDLDGLLDVVIAKNGRIEIYAHHDGPWHKITATDITYAASGLLTLDLDRDAGSGQTQPNGDACGVSDLDLLVYGDDGIAVLENVYEADGTRSLILRPQERAFQALRGVLTASGVDLDHDGDLDLVVSSESGLSLWSNRGDFTFADISARSALPPTTIRATSLIPVDWNRTIDIDLILAGAGSTAGGLLENHRHGRFRWLAGGFESLGGKALALGDFDGNVSWDLLLASEHGLEVLLTQTPDEAIVRAPPPKQISDVALAGVTSWDFDNDGYVDVLAWGPEGLFAWRGAPAATFEAVEDLFPRAGDEVTGAQVADIDGDGDEDVLVIAKDGVRWLSNDGGNANHWLDITLSGQRNADQKDERVNMYGVGSLLEIKSGPQYQAQVVTGPKTHFGLGSRDVADVARVLWTNGIPQSQIHPQSNTPICEVQILKGSCPYLYTWNGSRFEFVTDLLWAAPIGLQLAENVLAPARDWEYLKIPGEQLVAADNEYRLKITEELWEAAYFDRVKLIAVDHPEEVDIYTNEKVGPASIAQFRVHTVRNPLSPVSAHDQSGRDVLEIIAQQDEQYLKSFETRRLQGLVDAHYLELDLGPLEDPERVMLFLTGWVFPTDTSLNIAISQNPALESPHPPSLWVPDANGQWQQVMPYMGFPGGKTKTIAIDLSEVFLTNDYRLRIATSMELYWDHVFFTIDEPVAEFELTELELLGAELAYRGYSNRLEHAGHGPESYNYENTNPAQQWPVMQGQLSAYGEVGPLIRDRDDRLLVMGAGDDLSLRFRVPSTDLRPGWKRDFILHNVGWDKDADLNTVYGDTVEPLPYSHMTDYTDPIARAAREQGGSTPATRSAKARGFIRWVKQFQTL